MRFNNLQIQIAVQRSEVRIRGRLPEYLVALECNVVGTDGTIVSERGMAPTRHRVLLGVATSGPRGIFLSIRRNFDRHKYSRSQKFKMDKIRLYEGIATRRRRTSHETKALKTLMEAITIRVAPHYPKMFVRGEVEEFMEDLHKYTIVAEVTDT